jgi:fumarylpyruvate hydrolase
MSLAFELQPVSVEVSDGSRFPVRRIFCVGKNYADHVREMGSDPEREPPFFFSKPADAVIAANAEIELVVAIGQGGASIPAESALAHVFGYAVGNDLTRRDLQAEAKADGRPWDMAKGFDNSAVVSPLRPVDEVGHPERARIWLNVNGMARQDGDIAEMIWSVPAIIAELSTYVVLMPGDLIFTGTPAGVGRIARGDRVEGAIEGIGELANRFF